MPNKSSPHGGFFHTGTISHGTLRTQDLLRAFSAELARLKPFSCFALLQEADGTAALLDGEPVNADYEAAAEILIELEDELNEIATREGNFYFGTLEGDGSDFGFWQCEEEEA